jgi:alkylation response protein AidB-like acyl-CoA dehydrogenase
MEVCTKLFNMLVEFNVWMFGATAMGLSQDTPLAHFWAWARTLQLADGPDEVIATSTIARVVFDVPFLV